MTRNISYFSRGWVFCWDAGCSSTGGWVSGGAAAASAWTDSGLEEGEAGLAWGWALAGDWTFGGDWLALAGDWPCVGEGDEDESEAWADAGPAGWGLGEALGGGVVCGLGWICGFEFLRTGGMGFAGGVGFGGNSFGLPGAADGEPWVWGLGCSVVGAEGVGEPGAGAEAWGEPGAGAAAALAGEDGDALAGPEAESGADFVTDGALVIGGGLGTGGLVTEAAFWTGLGFWDWAGFWLAAGPCFWAWLGFTSDAPLANSDEGSTLCDFIGAPKKVYQTDILDYTVLYILHNT